MSDSEKVQCDHCDELFKIHLKEKHHPSKVIESYFKCPSCGEKYITHVTDDWARKEQQAIKKLNDERLRRKSKLANHMDRLKIRIQGTQIK